MEIQLTASHQELASQIGTVRELISRNLTRLQAQSFLEVTGREIIIQTARSSTVKNPASRASAFTPCSSLCWLLWPAP